MLHVGEYLNFHPFTRYTLEQSQLATRTQLQTASANSAQSVTAASVAWIAVYGGEQYLHMSCYCELTPLSDSTTD